jgi:hypothetical protein
MSTLTELRAQLKAKREEHQAKYDTAPRAELWQLHREVKRLGDAINALITAGAKPCEDCGAVPLGMVQEISIKNEVHEYFEIGCSACQNHRAQGFTIEQAVQKWNDEKYLPKRAQAEVAPTPKTP